tara:strand:- start:2169 stop:2453 length:285 start_codon:yes stop_codon:yes gene_type:complete
MIDTDKYEGISEDRVWKQYSTGLLSDYVYDYNEADQNLVADAPVLLAEVKRLRKQLSKVKNWVRDCLTDINGNYQSYENKALHADFMQQMGMKE